MSGCARFCRMASVEVAAGPQILSGYNSSLDKFLFL